MADARPHIVIVGGGYVGMYTAFRLQKKLHSREARVTVIDPFSFMTYQPFLPEAAAGSVEPRHVVVPLRRVLRKCSVVAGRVTKIDHGSRTVSVQMLEGGDDDLTYDELVVAPGSVPRTVPIPGLRERGIGFHTLGEATYLRNHVLSRMDIANSATDPGLKRRTLAFLFVGGGYAGIEVFAELEDMAHSAMKYYPNLVASDMRWVLAEKAERILPEVSKSLAAYTVNELGKRGMEVRLNTGLSSCTNGHVVLDDGTEFDAETIVWTAGVKPSSLLGQTDLPLDGKKRLVCDANLRVRGLTGAWSAGDCAAVPDLTKTAKDPNATCAPTAQHAVRQAKQLGDNIVASLRGESAQDYKHAYVGSVASLGLHKGVADVYGVKLRGYPAWFMHRTYHISRMPTLNRKLRIVTDWTIALFFRREVVSLGQLQNPRMAFEDAATPTDLHHEH